MQARAMYPPGFAKGNDCNCTIILLTLTLANLEVFVYHPIVNINIVDLKSF